MTAMLATVCAGKATAASAVLSPLGAGAIADYSHTVALTVTITFKTDGSITYSGSASGAAAKVSGPAWWHSAPAGGVGTGVYLRVTPTTGSLTTNPASTWTQLTSDLAIVRTVNRYFGPAHTEFTVELAGGSGGSPLYVTSTLWMMDLESS